MAEDEEVEATEEVMEEKETKNKKYVTATLDKTADAELIRRYSRLQKLAGFGSRDVVEAGVEALQNSDEYKKSLQEIKDELDA